MVQLTFLFQSEPLKSLCIFHLHCLSVGTNHVSHVANGYSIGQHQSKEYVVVQVLELQHYLIPRMPEINKCLVKLSCVSTHLSVILPLALAFLQRNVIASSQTDYTWYNGHLCFWCINLYLSAFVQVIYMEFSS